MVPISRIPSPLPSRRPHAHGRPCDPCPFLQRLHRRDTLCTFSLICLRLLPHMARASSFYRFAVSLNFWGEKDVRTLQAVGSYVRFAGGIWLLRQAHV
ncbi:hypothetical protein BDZ89DRAFT_512455, partial [Hymenopellis radicata]